jgi:hypothetical protein
MVEHLTADNAIAVATSEQSDNACIAKNMAGQRPDERETS